MKPLDFDWGFIRWFAKDLSIRWVQAGISFSATKQKRFVEPVGCWMVAMTKERFGEERLVLVSLSLIFLCFLLIMTSADLGRNWRTSSWSMRRKMRLMSLPGLCTCRASLTYRIQDEILSFLFSLPSWIMSSHFHTHIRYKEDWAILA